MVKFIEITTKEGHAALFNVDRINFIVPLTSEGRKGNGTAKTVINYGNDENMGVNETAKEILTLINE